MKLKHLILPLAGALALWGIYRFSRGLVEPVDASKSQQSALVEDVRSIRYWNPFYGERPETERARIFEETKGLGERELLRYVWQRGLSAEMAPSRWDLTQQVVDIGKRIDELDASNPSLISPNEIRASLQMRVELARRMTTWAEQARETIVLYRDGAPERFTESAYRRSMADQSSSPQATAKAYFRWRVEGGGFHRFLRWTSHEIRRELLGRPQAEAESLMGLRGAELVSSHEYQVGSRYRYRVTPFGWVGQDGTRHDWYYEIEVDRRDPSEVKHAKPGFVYAANSGLSVTPNERYTKFMKRGVYPSDSVLDRALRSEQVKWAAKKTPFLRRVEVSYQVFNDHNLDWRPQCFWVVIDMSASIKNERRSQRLRFFVTSGLDGLSDWNGRPFEPDHVPHDTLGEMRLWGGTGARSGSN
jgi:hypothetical protein